MSGLPALLPLTRRTVAGALGAALGLHALVIAGAGLFRVDLGPAERSRPGRTIQILTVPARWQQTLGAHGAAQLVVFADGAHLSSLDVEPAAYLEGGRPSHFRYEAETGSIVISCTPVLPCRTALVVPRDPRLALPTVFERVSARPSQVTGVAALFGSGLALLFLIGSRASSREFASGSVLFGVVLAAGLSRGSEVSPWILPMEALALASPLVFNELQRRMPAYVWADLLLWRLGGDVRPAWWRIAKAVSLAAIVAAVAIRADSLAPPQWEATTPDFHRDASLEIALNRVLCSHDSRFSTGVRIPAYLTQHPEQQDQPLRGVVRRAAGSLDEYCRSVVKPYVNNENSLMLAMAGLIAFQSDLSVRQLGWGLQLSRLLALLVVAWVLVEAGASLFFTALVLAGALCVLANLGARYYSVYPFLPVLPTLIAALLVLSVHVRLPERVSLHTLAAGLMGLLVAFAANMRSSHLPVYLAFIAVYVVAAHGGSRGHGRREVRAAWTIAAAGGAILGYSLFSLLLIRPLHSGVSASGDGQGLSHHTVAHPLVLGLALPPNSLTAREGIAWADPSGVELARRVDPNVDYLTTGYERALFHYYRQLWRRYPAEMGEIYLVKLWHAGADMIRILSDRPHAFIGGPWLRTTVLPLQWVSNGITLLGLYATALLLGLLAAVRTPSTLATVAALFAAGACLFQIESAAVIPFFHLSHHGAQLLCHLVLCALIWQLALQGGWCLLRSIARALRPAVSDLRV